MKNFLKFLLVGLLCLAPTLGSDATQRVATLVSPQAINVDVGFVQVGDVGNLSIMGAPNGATFRLLNNPGGHFGIVGTEIIADDSTPAGKYSLTVEATGDGFVPVKKTFVLNFSGHFAPPPAGVFSVGINLVGAQAQFPTFASTAQINYHAARLHGSLNPTPKFRFAIGWSQPNNVVPFSNPPLNGVVGIQPVAFGPLDTTSTAYGGTSYIGAMNRVISDVMAAGGQVLIDVHTFGSNFSYGAVGSAGCPFSCFADLWGKIADYYVHVRPDLLPGIYGFDLMNEWEFIDSSIAFNGNQAAITAARANGYTGALYIEGVNFTSAWNWTSGQGQSFNNSNLYQLVDPLNNLVSSAHMYPDPDDSGSQGARTFAHNVAVGTPGSAPPGLDVNPTIAVTRITREWQPWLQLHGLRGHVGEYGSSTDSPWIGGLFDYADWNTITRNLLTYLQANDIEISVWASGNGGAGYSSSGYGYSLDPFNSNLTGAADYSATGVQAPMWTVLDDFTGYSGAQPQAYAFFQPGLATPNLYTTVGAPSAPFTIYYGGKITSPATITPHDTLLDGTSGGGTFTPATITLAAGDNGLATFTYTPSQAATFKISTTNNRGWFDPPTIGFSSQGTTDPYAGLNYVALSNMYGMYDRFTPNIGPSLRLQRVSDNQQLDWSFTLLGNGFAQFDRGAIQTWASARSGIPITTIHSIGPIANDITCTGSTLPTLNLQNAAGYPEIVVPSGVACEFSTPIPGTTALSTIARMNQTTAGAFYRMDWIIGPIVWLNGNFQIFSTGFSGPPPGTLGPPGQGAVNQSLSLGIVNGQYHDYGASYASGVTNGFQTYKDGSQVAQATVTYQFQTQNNQTGIEFAHFKNGAQAWAGSFTNFELVPGLNYTPTQQASIAAMDATYYSTPLPDVLPAIPPTIASTLHNFAIFPGIVPPRPFGTISVTDTNSGSPTETVTITLSGAAGTLSGSGISGTGPYTVGPDTPTNVTTTLNQALFTTAAGVGSTTTFTLNIVSSAGSSASNGNSSTVVTTYSPQAAFTPPAGTFTPLNHSGYNLAGEELNVGLGPSHTQLDYMNATGFGLMRYVMSSQFLYTTAFGQFNSSYLATMKAVIDYAYTKNIYVVIDPHNGGSIWDATTGTFKLILPNMRSSDLFQDFSRRMTAAFVNYPNVIYGLMNEPAGMTAVQWRDGAITPAFTAIRATGSTQLVFIPGVGQSSALGWASNGNTAAFAGYAGDPLNNFAFEAHQYLDSSASGGSSVATLNGSTILNTFNSFLTANSFKGFLGEFGMAPDPFLCNGTDTLHYVPAGTSVTTNSITANSAMLSGMVSSGLYVGWAAWGGGYEFATPPNPNGYAFNPEPLRSGFSYTLPIVDQQQIAPLLSNTINFLMKRDVDPASNDNSPMWLEQVG